MALVVKKMIPVWELCHESRCSKGKYCSMSMLESRSFQHPQQQTPEVRTSSKFIPLVYLNQSLVNHSPLISLFVESSKNNSKL